MDKWICQICARDFKGEADLLAHQFNSSCEKELKKIQAELDLRDELHTLRARLAAAEAALERIAAGNPGKPGQWLADIEMADIARAALAARATEER